MVDLVAVKATPRPGSRSAPFGVGSIQIQTISRGLFWKSLRRVLILLPTHQGCTNNSLAGFIMNSTFNTIAAVAGHQAGVGAETVANIEVYLTMSDSVPNISLNAPLVLHRFGTTSLFRIVALSNTFPGRNQMVLCLPTDCAWNVSQLRKIKGARSGKKAVQFDVVLTPAGGHAEGFDKIVIAIPYDGEDGNALLYYQAVQFASQEVRQVLGL
jgi:hypothetical protein